MIKTVRIDDREVKFKFSFASFYIFKNQFRYDPLQKVLPAIGEAINALNTLDISKSEITAEVVGDVFENVSSLEAIDLLNLIWAFAKTADRDIKEPEYWYDDFENFPLFDVVAELFPVFVESMGSKKKSTISTQA